MIETNSSEFDTHEYIKSVRHMRDEAYQECFNAYAEKYNIAAPEKLEKKESKVKKEEKTSK